MAEQSDNSLRDDVLRGVTAISQFIGLDERATYYALQNGFLPARKENRKTWVATKSRLRAFYNETDNTPGEHQR
jgi:hypothetical protein